MGEEINEVDLDRTRRLGTPKYDKVRPILVKIHKIHYKKQNFQKPKEIKGKKGQYNNIKLYNLKLKLYSIKFNKYVNGSP